MKVARLRRDDLLERAKELSKAAEQMEVNLGTPGAILVCGMLLNEGLCAVARAVRNFGDVAGAIEKVAEAILAADNS